MDNISPEQIENDPMNEANRKELNTAIGDVDSALSRLAKFRMDHLHESDFDQIETDSFGQLIDKLLVVHVRYWNLENEMSETLDDATLALKRRASEPLFKIYRPMLVSALDKKIANILISAETAEGMDFGQLPKSYKGWESRDI